MTTQLQMWPNEGQTLVSRDPAAPYVRHSPESRDAAKKISGDLERRQRDVLLILARYPDGLTDLELQAIVDEMAEPFKSARSRRVELTQEFPPLVEKVPGLRRPTPAGATAAVWRATEAGCRKAVVA